MPEDSVIGYTLSYIAMATFINIGMLSYSVLPTQYFLYFLGALVPLEIKLGVNYYTTNDTFYLILAGIFFLCEAVLLRRALINSNIAIQAIILNEKLKDEIQKHTQAQTHIEFLAYHDHLTGAWNRRYIESFLNKLLHSTQTQGKPFGVMLIDINYFKPINDTYGHNFGDELLCLFTQHLQSHLPQNAILGRFGGDEFIIVFENIASYQALEDHGRTLKKALFKTYTIIKTADERMYEDKKIDHQSTKNLYM